MKVQVRLFAICRERTGKDNVELSFTQNVVTVGELLDALVRQEPALRDLRSAVRVAVNQTFAHHQTPVQDGDELALIPPVSGGTGVILAEVRTTEIFAQEAEDAVRGPHIGAISTFTGTVRDHTGPFEVTALEYEAYTEMAEKMLRAIGGEVCERHPRANVAILHRIGLLSLGETTVIISVGSPHRAEAFDGCRHIIERLKQDAPIWKKERRGDGSHWVGMGS
ncbi:MAG: molybdopterin converting factor subunit 1 [Myxococcales bacterium]|nr:molybdopterin converting factor subunit 1 [Myxococcales bacterium]